MALSIKTSAIFNLVLHFLNHSDLTFFKIYPNFLGKVGFLAFPQP